MTDEEFQKRLSLLPGPPYLEEWEAAALLKDVRREATIVEVLELLTFGPLHGKSGVIY